MLTVMELESGGLALGVLTVTVAVPAVARSAAGNGREYFRGAVVAGRGYQGHAIPLDYRVRGEAGSHNRNARIRRLGGECIWRDGGDRQHLPVA